MHMICWKNRTTCMESQHLRPSAFLKRNGGLRYANGIVCCFQGDAAAFGFITPFCITIRGPLDQEYRHGDNAQYLIVSKYY